MTIDAIHRRPAWVTADPHQPPDQRRPGNDARVPRRPPTVDYEAPAAPILYPSELFAVQPRRHATPSPNGAGRVECPSPTHGASACPAAEGSPTSSDPLEVATTATQPTPRQVVTMLAKTWPELNSVGARTLAAQFMAETGAGRHCFNWNLGNIRARPNEPHMYLQGVWEVASAKSAHAQVAKAHGLAHIATREEIKKNGWACPHGTLIVVFDGHHPRCRFRAYASLAEGVRYWVAHHRHLAREHPTFVPALNGGDVDAVAHVLKAAHYYTAAPSDYARRMAESKAEIDRTLGPPRS